MTIKRYISVAEHANELTAEVRPGLPKGAGDLSPMVDIAPGNNNRKGGASLFIHEWETFRDEIDAEFARVKETE